MSVDKLYTTYFYNQQVTENSKKIILAFKLLLTCHAPLKVKENAVKMKCFGFAACALFAGMSGSAMAATYTFGAVTTTGLGNTQTFAATSTVQNEVAPDVKVSAWASTTSSVTSDIRQAYLESNGSQSLRVRSQNETTASPDHAMDNAGTFEALLFDFGAGSRVDLDAVKLSWWSNDSDLTILAYTGGSASYDPASVFATGAATSFSSLTSSGWTLIGEPSNIGTTNTTVNSTNQASRFWLIGAGGLTGTSYSGSPDYVKLAAITTTNRTPQQPPVIGVPEPESIALMGAALAGMVFVRRRRQA